MMQAWADYLDQLKANGGDTNSPDPLCYLEGSASTL